MKLRKASAWYYNKGKQHVVINELGITLHKGDVADLFKLNPNLTWEQYHRSATRGVLFQKRDKLIKLPGPPKQNYIKAQKTIPSGPIPSRSKSAFVLGRDNEDYLAAIENDFPADAQPLAQEEMWKTERDKYLESLSTADQGENGEVFSDKLFDEQYLDDLID